MNAEMFGEAIEKCAAAEMCTDKRTTVVNRPHADVTTSLVPLSVHFSPASRTETFQLRGVATCYFMHAKYS